MGIEVGGFDERSSWLSLSALASNHQSRACFNLNCNCQNKLSTNIVTSSSYSDFGRVFSESPIRSRTNQQESNIYVLLIRPNVHHEIA